MQPNAPLPGIDHDAATLPALTSGGTTGLIEMTVHGRWSYPLGIEVSAGIRSRLRERPTTMIIDLSDLADPDGASLALWLATRRACTVVRPPVALALCLPKSTPLDRRLGRIDVHRLPRFATMPEARAAMMDERDVTR